MKTTEEEKKRTDKQLLPPQEDNDSDEEKKENIKELIPKQIKKRIISNISMIFGICVCLGLIALTMILSKNNIGVEVKRVDSDEPGPGPIPPGPDPPEPPKELKISKSSTIEVSGKDIDANKADITIGYYFAFAFESIALGCLITYLGISFFNKLGFLESFETPSRKTLAILLIIFCSAIFMSASVFITNLVILKNHVTEEYYNSLINEDEEATGFITIDGKNETLTEYYETNKQDESVILVKNEGIANIIEATANKTGGDSSNTENSEFYGINAGILATGKNSKIFIINSTIQTNAKGSNAVFSTEESEIEIKNSIINTYGESSSRGLDSTYGGTIIGENLTIVTQGGSCATLATDRGEGTVTCTNCDLTTNGAGSPVIYSTGEISLIDSIGKANGAQCIVIEGKNSATITNSEITAVGTGNRGNVDSCGVMIYQSMSGDADTGVGTLNCYNSNLTITTSNIPFFFVTNTEAVINLDNCILSFNGTFLDIKGTSEWGKEGENGGNVTLLAKDELIEGDIILDNISSLNLYLNGTTHFIGAINSNNESAIIHIYAENSTIIELTNTSYISSYEGPNVTSGEFIIVDN